MATKAELLKRAKAQKLDVNTKTTKADLESMLKENGSNTTSEAAAQVLVNRNEGGEATNGTTQEGSERDIHNTTSVPQNGVSSVETLDVTDNEVAKRADEARDGSDVEFSDESNPNQKARNAATEGQEFDQDGNPRTGGYSYGVAPDDTTGTVHDPQNDGTHPDELGDRTDILPNRAERIGSFVNPEEGEGVNENEWSVEDQFALEEKLSDEAAGIRARVTTSAGNYVRVKFFYNNKPLGTFRSRNYSDGDAEKFLADLRKERDI